MKLSPPTLPKKSSKRGSSGFVGLLVLLVAVAVIAYLAISFLVNIYGQSGESNIIEEGHSVIDSAEEAKRLIESRY